MQRMKVFFGEDHPEKFGMPSLEDRQWAVNSHNLDSPFSKFVGNEKAIRKLQASAFDALGKSDHLCRDLAFSIFGPASSGKTSLAKLFAQTVKLPFVEISPKSCKTMDDLLREIERVLALEYVPLVEVTRENYFHLPPCIIFLDEVHALPKSLVQGLLKATEFTDAVMVTESGKTVNCFNVC